MKKFHGGPKVGLILLLCSVLLISGCTSSSSYPVDEPLTAANMESNLAIASRAMGDNVTDRAIEICDSILEYIDSMREHIEANDPNFEWLDYLETETYFIRASSFFNAGDMVSAIDNYDEAIRISPRNSRSYYYRAQARHLLGDHQGALDDSLEAIEIFPWDTSYYEFMYYLRNNMGLDARADVKLLHQLNLLIHWEGLLDGPMIRAVPFVPMTARTDPGGNHAFYQVLAYPDGSVVTGDFLRPGDVVSGIAVAERFTLENLGSDEIAYTLEPMDVIDRSIRILSVEIEFFMVDGLTMMGTFIYEIHYQIEE